MNIKAYFLDFSGTIVHEDGARNTGIKSVWINRSNQSLTGAYTPDLTIKKMDELLDLEVRRS